MAVLKAKIGGAIIQVGGPGTPQPVPGANPATPNTFTADQTFTGKLLPRGNGASSVRVGDIVAANVAAGAVVLGDAASGTSANVVAVGNSAVASGTLATAVGYQAVASGANRCVALGRFAQALGTSATALGGDTQALGAFALASGYQAIVEALVTGGTALGQGAEARYGTFAGPQLAVGYLASSKEGRAVAVGPQARAWGISSTAVGRGAIALGTHAIAIGRGAWADATANMISIGFSGGNAQTDVYFESGHTHKYDDPIDATTITRVPNLTPIAIHGFDAFDATAAPTNNVAGGSLRLLGGRGTGTAIGGSVTLEVAPAGGAANNTKNALVKVVEAGVSGTASTLGFFAGVPATKWAALPADATDLATAIALVNDIKNNVVKRYSLAA